jgi:glycolate oxidase iron-sulfur subunit
MATTKKNLCAKCGACTAVCPIYQITGQESLTARGRLHLLDKLGDAPHSTEYLEIFSKCLLCDACRHSCPRHIDLPGMVAAARHDFPRLSGQGPFTRSLVKNILSRPRLLSGFTDLLRKLPADSGLRLKLGVQDKTSPAKDLPPEHIDAQKIPVGAALFPGCFARHLNSEVTASTVGLIAERTGNHPTIPETQTCCGIAAFSSGDPEEAQRLARTNIAAFDGSNDPIIVPCGSCYSHLQKYPELLRDDPDWYNRAEAFAGRIREMSAFLVNNDQNLAKRKDDHKTSSGKKVFYHDPCHLRFKPGLQNAPRQLIRQISGVLLVEPESGPQCCGFGGLFNLAHPDLSAQLADSLIDTIMHSDPDLVVTTCSGCLIQLREKLARTGSKAKVKHLALFLADPFHD